MFFPAVSVEKGRKIRWFAPCFYSTDFKQTSSCPCLCYTFLVMGNFAILAFINLAHCSFPYIYISHSISHFHMMDVHFALGHIVSSWMPYQYKHLMISDIWRLAQQVKVRQRLGLVCITWFICFFCTDKRNLFVILISYYILHLAFFLLHLVTYIDAKRIKKHII